jgi:hypothetical protein
MDKSYFETYVSAEKSYYEKYVNYKKKYLELKKSTDHAIEETGIEKTGIEGIGIGHPSKKKTVIMPKIITDFCREFIMSGYPHELGIGFQINEKYQIDYVEFVKGDRSSITQLNPSIIYAHTHPLYEDNKLNDKIIHQPMSHTDFIMSLFASKTNNWNVLFEKNGIWLYRPDKDLLKVMNHYEPDFHSRISFTKHGFSFESTNSKFDSFIEVIKSHTGWYSDAVGLKEGAYDEENNIREKLDIDGYIKKLSEFCEVKDPKIYGIDRKKFGFEIQYFNYDAKIEIEINSLPSDIINTNYNDRPYKIAVDSIELGKTIISLEKIYYGDYVKY